MSKYNNQLKEAGVLLTLDGLQETGKGARVGFAGGKPKVTDGPFPEAKEVIGGYWMIEAPSKEEAVAWATRCPAADGDIIEIRQVYEMRTSRPRCRQPRRGRTGDHPRGATAPCAHAAGPPCPATTGPPNTRGGWHGCQPPPPWRPSQPARTIPTYDLHTGRPASMLCKPPRRNNGGSPWQYGGERRAEHRRETASTWTRCW